MEPKPVEDITWTEGGGGGKARAACTHGQYANKTKTNPEEEEGGGRGEQPHNTPHHTRVCTHWCAQGTPAHKLWAEKQQHKMRKTKPRANSGVTRAGRRERRGTRQRQCCDGCRPRPGVRTDDPQAHGTLHLHLRPHHHCRCCCRHLDPHRLSAAGDGQYPLGTAAPSLHLALPVGRCCHYHCHCHCHCHYQHWPRPPTAPLLQGHHLWRRSWSGLPAETKRRPRLHLRPHPRPRPRPQTCLSQ